ncbi:MAG: hypothetical protein U9Q07_10590 [Planctomycetota bacterium]|nr:hypothetical protein [Planctomycetota bacterium]
MNETRILLQAYYELLYERLEAEKPLLAERIGELLAEEVGAQGYEGFDDQKHAAYRDACLAFVDERIEAYNPIGLQYLFDREVAKDAFELELQLDWYDSRAEFEVLVRTARSRAEDLTEESLQRLTEELVRQVGAFPDKSIIAGYEGKPALRKLPDYIVARTIEEIIA